MIGVMNTAPDWVRDFYAAVDSGDSANALGRMSPDIHVQFAGRPPVDGREQAAATMGAFHASHRRVSHRILNVWPIPGGAICEFTATYELHDGSLLPLPSLTVLTCADGLITNMRVYLDEGPLLAGPDPEPPNR
jgi:ketosteroid isomerase-like protein